MSANRSETLLRRALFANASFSTASAATCLLATGAVAAFTGVPAADVSSLGAELGIFALGIFALLSQDLTRTWARRVVAGIIALDALWVVGSVVLLVMPNPLTSAGQWTVGLVALVVADFAAFQWMGWRGMARNEAADVALEATPDLA